MRDPDDPDPLPIPVGWDRPNVDSDEFEDINTQVPENIVQFPETLPDEQVAAASEMWPPAAIFFCLFTNNGACAQVDQHMMKMMREGMVLGSLGIGISFLSQIMGGGNAGARFSPGF